MPGPHGSGARRYPLTRRLGDDRQGGHRYNTACAASLAGCGEGKDEPKPDEAARAALRAKALGWLREDLAAWSRSLEADPGKNRAVILQKLGRWKKDADLSGVRDEAGLSRLPDAERAEWKALWSDVDKLPAKANP